MDNVKSGFFVGLQVNRNSKAYQQVKEHLERLPHEPFLIEEAGKCVVCGAINRTVDNNVCDACARVEEEASEHQSNF